jgi:DnaK suppressor protein
MDELTDDQIETLRADLQRLQAELERQISQTRDGAKPVDLDEPIGRLSRMDAMQQQKMVEANRRASLLRLDAVKRALAAVEEGDYGWCRLCDESIGFQRLQAKPEVVVCIRCQSERERRG